MNAPSPLLDESQRQARDGVIAALAAYLIWGVLPIYFKIVDHVPAMEVLAHRIIWAVPFGLLIILGRNQWPEVRLALRNRRTLGWLALAAVFIALNWLVYIWAVQNDQIYQASLGYYINPLLYVVIGVLFLGERLRPWQIAAVGLAALGVTVLTVSGGQFPLISLVLAVSFTIYGVIRKRLNIGGMPGLLIETLLLLPFAGGYLLLLLYQGRAAFGSHDLLTMGELLLAGPLTVLPLLAFALAARRLNLSTVGIMQFIAPTMQFLVGVAYGEVLTTAHIICFSLIWTAVALFSWDALRNRASALAKVST